MTASPTLSVRSVAAPGLMTFRLVSMPNPRYGPGIWPGEIVAMNHDLHLIHVVEGSIEFRLGDGRRAVGDPETVIAIPPFETYSCHRKTQNAVEMINLHFQITWEGGGELGFPLLFRPQHPERHHRRLRQCLKAWKHPGALSSPRSRWQSALRLQELIATYARGHGELSLPGRIDPTMQAARLALEEAQTFHAAAFARQAGLSLPQFNRRFRAAFGLSPKTYWQHCRLRLARALLGEQDLSIKEVAETLGFSDAFYFSRWFKRMQGHPPSVHRELRVLI